MGDLVAKILLAVVAAVIGAGATYAFSAYGKLREEARRQRTEAYLNYLKAAEGSDIPLKVYTRNAVLTFGTSSVIRSLADAYRASAVALVGDKKAQYIERSQDSQEIMAWVRTLQTIRNEFNSDDPISDTDILTLLCPDPTQTCYRVWYSKHLF